MGVTTLSHHYNLSSSASETTVQWNRAFYFSILFQDDYEFQSAISLSHNWGDPETRRKHVSSLRAPSY